MSYCVCMEHKNTGVETAYTDKAANAIDEALHKVRDVITVAAAAGAFCDVGILARAATSLQDIASALRSGKLDGERSRTNGREQAVVLNMLRSGPRQEESVGAKRDSYPQYFRDGGRLVKRAWSKKERQPYEHKAPQEVIEALLKSIRKARGDQKPFEAADIMPLNRDDGEEYPSYQSYLALGWLRHVGAIAKGRQGYLLKKDWPAERIAQSWDALTTVA